MSSTNKTANLGLNAWIGSDHPTRTDFVSDNSIIDSTLGSHTKNSEIHLTSAEKSRISSPFQVVQHLGTGEESIVVNLSFEPKLVLIQKKNSPSVAHETSGDVINGGFVVPGFGGTKGLSLTGSRLSLSYSASMSGGARANFNESGIQYIIVAFK